MKSMPSVSIIVPTFREAENLPILVPQVAQAMRSRGWTWELIVVDDNSKDATPQVLEELSATFPQFRYKIRTTERGLSSAVLAGMAMSRHEYIVVMDADLSHPPESVPSLVDGLIKGDGEFVIGSRYVNGGRTEDWGFLRWVNSAGATMLAKPLSGSAKDPMAGFFALSRATLSRAEALNPIGYKIGLELIVKCKVKKVAEVPIVFRNRIHGESKLTMKEQFRYLEHLSRLYDCKFPRASAQIKFLIAAGCGAAAVIGVMLGLERFAEWPFVASMAAGLVAMIAVTLAFFARYVKAQRDFISMKSPWWEFAYISLAEFLAGWFVAVRLESGAVIRASAGIAVLLLVRYTLRKLFLHDIRGIRGTPKPAATMRIEFAQAEPAAANAAGA
jgi:dolichol-phosphate mannosyltransferase